MPRLPIRLWRFLLPLALLAGLMATPAAVSADPVIRFSEHGVFISCDASGPEGDLHLSAGTSSEFGASAELFAWAAPVDPESPPDVSGTSDMVTVVEAGGGATLTTTIPLVDPDGMDVGDAIVTATLTPTGEVLTLEPFREGNRWIKTTGTVAFMEVTGTLVLPGDLPDFALEDLGCGGEIFDVEVFETQPHAFVFANEGIVVDCFWESDGTFAHLFAVNDGFGTYAETSLFIEGEHDIFGSTEEVSLDATSLAVDIPVFDFLNEEEGTASATATLTPEGEPVTSIVISQTGRDRLTEQLLIPDGTLTFLTGDQFAMDAENCLATEFDVHAIDSPSAGPKPGGKAPVNDTPEGAIPIEIGDSLNAQTRGAAPEPELQVTTCPAFDDAFGRTLWYTFTGTGGEVTIDTAGSNFDTMVAVYDEELVELACNDDVEFGPVGFTFQAAVTVDTIEGATYYVQAGGFLNIFEGLEAEFGRLRLSIE
jgi:hypothetical protein